MPGPQNSNTTTGVVFAHEVTIFFFFYSLPDTGHAQWAGFSTFKDTTRARAWIAIGGKRVIRSTCLYYYLHCTFTWRLPMEGEADYTLDVGS